MQSRRLDTHAELGNSHTREWIETVLAFLKAFVEQAAHVDMRLLGKGDVGAYIADLIKEVRQIPSELDKGNLAVNCTYEFQLDG